MVNYSEVRQHLAAAQEHLSVLFIQQGRQFDPEVFEDLLASLKDTVDTLGIDLNFISCNHFELYSEFVLDYAEHHPAKDDTNITQLQEHMAALVDMADDENNAQDFLDPISQVITELAVLALPQFEGDEEDLLCELSVFDDEGIGEVDDDAESDDLPY